VKTIENTSGSIYDLDNYRGITLTSNVNKVFSKILDTLILDFLESNNILGETQGAFRKDRRIEDQIFSLQGIASLYKSSRKPLYLAFLDLSKAFDRVWRDGLFALLWENGIKGKCWRLLRKMYEKVENKVIFERGFLEDLYRDAIPCKENIWSSILLSFRKYIV
jgi:hypothetical protein